MSNSLVIIPTYNEKDNIANIIKAVFTLDTTSQYSFHLLVIDDGSPDGTAAIVKQLIKKFPEKLFIIERDKKQGLGTAYIHGFKWALQKNYEFICQMDADFSHNPHDLIRLRSACQNQRGHMAVGSRYVKKGKCENWAFNRMILSIGASIYVRLITRMPIKDPTAGFVCYRRKVLESINLNKIQFVGYAFQIEMKYAALSLGYRISEIPITFIDRVNGVSKMSKNIFKEAVFGIIIMHWNNSNCIYAKNEKRSKLRMIHP